jgi:hypothetical protein
VTALQARSPEFKPKSHQKRRKKKKAYLLWLKYLEARMDVSGWGEWEAGVAQSGMYL